MNAAIISPGLIGGLVGLAFGIADWLLFTLLIVPKLEEGARKEQRRATSVPILKAAFFLSCFIAFPIVGYIAGRLIFPDFGVTAGG